MKIIEIIKAVILGVVEGVTEWLPISSTGHMILADEFLRLDVTETFMELFLVAIQLGAILAVIVLYRRRLIPLPSLQQTPSRKSVRDTLLLWLKIAVACIPTAIIGFLFDEKINELFFNYTTVAAALIFYGILFIVIEGRRSGTVRVTEIERLDYKTALFIGLFQVLSLIPGTSRSGATILGAILLGTSRTVAAEFSFFLAVPIMLGASLLKLIKFGFVFTGAQITILLTGALAAFIVSILAIKFLTEYVRRHDFKVFGWYRIALGVIVLVYFHFAG